MNVIDFCVVYGCLHVYSWNVVATSLSVHSLLEGHVGDVE